MELIRVAVNGALGRMGREIVKAVVREPGFKVVGAAEREVTQRYLPIAETVELVPFSSDLGSLLKKCPMLMWWWTLRTPRLQSQPLVSPSSRRSAW